MSFSFFTKRREYTSGRLRFVARGLQIFGVVSGALIALVALSLSQATSMHWPDGVREAYLRQSGVLAVGQLVSYFFIGRALLRRQRLGAYVAMATIGLPFVLRLLGPHKANLPWLVDVTGIGLPVLTLALIASVWHELGTLRDSEMIDHRREPKPETPLTPRNRGYGEPHILPHPISDLTVRTPESVGHDLPR